MKATQEFGTARADAYSIIEDTLNLRSVTVRERVEDSNGNIGYVVNRNETIAARAKQDSTLMPGQQISVRLYLRWSLHRRVAASE
jgi:hypothetical protein